MQFRNSLLPLYALSLKKSIPDDPRDFRYLGMSYHFNDQGNIATCKHIVESLEEHEALYGVELHGDRLMFKVEDIRSHPKYDFSVGFVSRKIYEAIPLHEKKEVYIGTNVFAYGSTNEGIINGKLVTTPRLMKGHIVRTFEESFLSDARSTCEISFPSLKGFSGTPLFFDNEKTSAAGMLFSNLESTIELHQFQEIERNGKMYSERVHKVIELGIAHTAYDVRVFLKDLNIKRVATDASPSYEI